MEQSEYTVYNGNEPYIFVSYAHKDQARVLPLICGMQEQGFRVWFDSGIEAGTEWPEYIAERLEGCGCIVAFISPNAVDSPNCRREINFAIDLRKDALVIYLEETPLSAGMRMQLGTLQAMFRYRHNDDGSFLTKLAEASLLQACRINSDTPAEVHTQLPPEACFSHGQYHQSIGNKQEAFKWFRFAAEQGHARAQYQLGECYETGYGVLPNAARSAKWHLASAQQGFPQAQEKIGRCFRDGIGVPQDHKQALLWFRQLNGPIGNIRLAECYENGYGVPQNYDEAIAQYRCAAENGAPEAQYRLGMYYFTGRRIPEDYSEAVKWFGLAANTSHAEAQCMLGQCYQSGLGVPKDEAAAFRHYRMAAIGGSVQARTHLGWCYLFGTGTTKNYGEAARLFFEAAEQGDRGAKYWLAKCYENGYGVPQDAVQACKWRAAAEQEGN